MSDKQVYATGQLLFALLWIGSLLLAVRGIVDVDVAVVASGILPPHMLLLKALYTVEQPPNKPI